MSTQSKIPETWTNLCSYAKRILKIETKFKKIRARKHWPARKQETLYFLVKKISELDGYFIRILVIKIKPGKHLNNIKIMLKLSFFLINAVQLSNYLQQDYHPRNCGSSF